MRDDDALRDSPTRVMLAAALVLAAAAPGATARAQQPRKP